MAGANANRSITDARALTGTQRAAVLVMYLKRPVARKLLAHLNVAQLQEIGNAMSEVENIAPEVIEAVVAEFIDDLYKVSLVPKTGPSYVLEVLPDLLDQEHRHKVVGPLKRRLSKSFEEYIKARPPKVVAAILRDEHPQTQALACLLMGPDNAFSVMQHLDEEERYDVALRMARVDKIPGEIADEVEEALFTALDDQGSDLWRIVGVDKAAQTLGRLEVLDQELLLGKIGDEDYDLSELLRRRMVVFDDLKSLSDRGVQMLLKNVDRETVVIALRGADAVMREVLLGNMSKRAAQDLRDELTMGSPVARSAVEKAQEEIVSIALRLRDEGVIALGSGGGASDMV